MSDFVSILIPAYNAERWIAQTLNSALAQTWARKEIIVVDDGSTDSTQNIVRTFSRSGVKLASQRNGGAPAARNKALSFAEGDYIQWLDADDLLAPDKIRLQLSARDCGSARELFTGPFGRFFYRHWRARFQPTVLWQDLTPIEWLRGRFVNGVWMNPAVWLVSRQLTETAGPWDERLSLSGDDDGEYVCRLVCAADRVRFVPAAASYYRESHPGSLSGRRDPRALDSFLLSTRLCINHLLSLENGEDARTACVRLIENRLQYFYLRPHLLAELTALATTLGVTRLSTAGFGKYGVIGQAFGWQYAAEVKHAVSVTRLATTRSLDRLLYTMAPASRRAQLQPGGRSCLSIGGEV